jgi:hypothetical protein
LSNLYLERRTPLEIGTQRNASAVDRERGKPGLELFGLKFGLLQPGMMDNEPRIGIPQQL